MTATEKSKKSGEVQVATLLTLLGPQGLEVFRTFSLDDAGKGDIAVVKKKFTDYFSPRIREEFERFKFYSRTQKSGESIDQYITALRDLISTCNFHDAEKDKALRDRLVFGIQSSNVREELFNMEGDITLQQVINVCQRFEATKQYMRGLPQMQAAPSDKSHAVHVPSTTVHKHSNPCRYCGSHHKPRQCPAYGKECKLCHKKGHFAKVCRSSTTTAPISNQKSSKTTPGKAHHVAEGNAPNTTDLAYATSSTTNSTSKEWYVTYKLNDKQTKLKVDTGSTCNIIPKTVFDRVACKSSKVVKHDTDLISFSGHKLNVIGKTSILVESCDQICVLDFVVVDAPDSTTLLGLEACRALGLVQVTHAITDGVAAEYSDVFEGLGRLPSKHALRLKDDAKPVVQSARRVPFRLHDKLKSTLAEMENQGTIKKVRQATDWVHPIVNVLKPNGSLRICLDPTELNKNIKREHYALPTPVEIFAKLASSTVFSSLDATSGFLQLELDEASSYLTTFATPFGRYRFLRLPYGISSAPEVFHRTVSEMFADLAGVQVFVDDILVHAPTKAEHDKILETVFKRCREMNFKLNLAKCRFSKSELKFLGHIIGQGCVKADPSKVEAIVNMPKPEEPADVLRLLGMATYLSKFCDHLSDVTAPFRELTKKDAVWQWAKNQHLEFTSVLKPFWNVRSDLSSHEGLVLKTDQIVIPVSMRKEVLDSIHKGHLGISRCVERAKNAVYWPGYINQITDLVESCAVCQEHARSNATDSIEPYGIPDYPMQQVSMDIFYLHGREYLVTVDRYSKWPHCTPLISSRSSEVIKSLETQFSMLGYPEILVSDNAPQFSSYEFKCFTQDRDIKHVTTSPYLSRSNGLSERMNQTIKNSLVKSLESGNTLADVLCTIRTTPLGNNLPSPAVLLQGREIRVGDGLHCTKNQLQPKTVDHDKIKNIFRAKQDQAAFSSSTGKQSVKFHVGMEVWVKMGHRKWTRGSITGHTDNPKSFMVQYSDGRVFRRSQHHLRPARAVFTPSAPLPPPPASQLPSTVAPSGGSVPQPQHQSPNQSVPQNKSAGPYVTRSGRVSTAPERFGFSK